MTVKLLAISFKPLFYTPLSPLWETQNAQVVEWQTRTLEVRMPKGVRVQVPS